METVITLLLVLVVVFLLVLLVMSVSLCLFTKEISKHWDNELDLTEEDIYNDLTKSNYHESD